ncbi:MAG TPA: hypothetical protein VHK69_16670 [Chitinophagaceae bacterium]|jgi:hypothetical protein|nr:hypothetical protein [Chitinophagaceae bacterium]
MEKMFLALGLCTLISASCTREPIEDLYAKAPRSELPAELSPAEWRYGSVSALSYYNDRGDHVAHSEEALREYKVTRDGYVEFVQYLSVPSGNCYNVAFTYLKGTMKFEAPNKILWTPVEGEFYKKFPCSGTDDTRKATQADLDRSRSEYWYKWDDFGIPGGTEYLVLFNHPSMLPQYQVFAYDVIR